MNDPTQGLFKDQLNRTNVHPKYQQGYMDALLDVYLLVKFANLEPVFLAEP